MKRGLSDRWLRPWLAMMLAGTVPLTAGGLDFREEFALRITAAHNRERTALGIPAIVWDEALAADAAAWAKHLSELRHLVHSPDDEDDDDPEGENLWAGTHDSYDAEQMVAVWSAERKDFRPGRFPDNATSGGLDAIGHYTQMVWRSTTRVGCAVADDGANDYLVCRYREGGNVLGERPY